MDVPINPLITSEEKRFKAVLMVERSDSLLESLACFKSSAGLRVKMTTTERMATNAKTTNNSINVNDERGLPRRGPFGARSSIRVKEDRFDEPACRQAGVKDSLLFFNIYIELSIKRAANGEK